MTMLELQVRTENAVHDLVERTRDEKGQTSIEYLGIVVVVGLILTAILAAAPGWGTTIVGKINAVLSKIGG